MIRLEDVWYRYPGQRGWALRGATVEAPAGAVTVVVGPNGSGKTTMLKMMALLLEPTRGRVIAWGREPWKLPEAERLALRRRVVYVHERPIMLRGTVLDNLAAAPRLRGAPPGEARQRALEAAERLGLTGLLDRRARSLSRGQQQLVAVARALTVDPEVIILDEPFAHLDIGKRRLLARLLSELKSRGRGVVFSTHDTLLASRLADRVVIVEDGAARTASPRELEELESP